MRYINKIKSIMSQRYNRFTQKIAFLKTQLCTKTWFAWEKRMLFSDSAVKNSTKSFQKNRQLKKCVFLPSVNDARRSIILSDVIYFWRFSFCMIVWHKRYFRDLEHLKNKLYSSFQEISAHVIGIFNEFPCDISFEGKCYVTHVAEN